MPDDSSYLYLLHRTLQGTHVALNDLRLGGELVLEGCLHVFDKCFSFNNTGNLDDSSQHGSVGEVFAQLLFADLAGIDGADLALIAVVGRGMKSNRGVAARVLASLAHRNINVRMIDQGSSELNIILGVSNADFETAIQAIYDIFVTTRL